MSPIGRGRQVGEERRLLHVGRVGVPVVDRARRGRQRPPALVAVPDAGVLVVELLFGDARRQPPSATSLGARPQVAQEDRTVGPSARAGRVDEVDVDPARQRVGDARAAAMRGRWRAPAGGSAPRSSGCRRARRRRSGRPRRPPPRPRSIERARVADAGRAAVADEREAELLEVGREPGAVEVVGDHARARARARSSPTGCVVEPGLDRLLREQAGGQHHRRVRGVRARGDRGDHDRAVRAPCRRPAVATAAPESVVAAGELVLRATGRPRPRTAPTSVGLRIGRRRVAERRRRTSPRRPAAARGPAAASDRRARARPPTGPARATSLNTGSGSPSRTEQPLLLRVALDQVDASPRPVKREVARASRRRPGSTRRSRRTRGTCSTSVARSAIGSVDSPSPKNSTNLPTTPCAAQHLRERQHEVGGGGAGAAARRPRARRSRPAGGRKIGWPSIAASASMPPTPQPSTPRPLIIVVCESVPTSVSGKRHAVAQPTTTLRRGARGSPGGRCPRRAAPPGSSSKACCAQRRSA